MKKDIELNFPDNSIREWEEAAKIELGGDNPFVKLSQNKFNLSIKPFYTAADLPKVPVIEAPVAENSFLGARTWHNSPRVVVENVEEANKKALFHLSHGADGVFFELRNAQVHPGELLKSIELPFCHLTFFFPDSAPTFLSDFETWAPTKFEKTAIAGSFFWKKNLPSSLSSGFDQWPLFSSVGFVEDREKAPADALAGLLKQAVDFVEESNTSSAVHKVGFQVFVDEDFFFAIAKLKALRHLWHQVAGAYGVKITKPVAIHAISEAWSGSEFDPHGNVIKQTMSAISAIAGGCTILTCDAADESSLAMRLSRNISTILREESHLNAVADPVAGSYFLESLAADLAKETWHRFQNLFSNK